MKSSLPSTVIRSLPGLDDPAKIRPKFSLVELEETVRALALGPKACWQVIKYDRKSFTEVFEHYVFFLAAIPSLAGFIGHGLFGYTGIGLALLRAVIGYFMSIGFFYAAVLVAEKTAPMFDGTIGYERAAKLVIYSLIPYFVFGSLLLLPGLSAFSLAGVISVFYFLWGVRDMSNIPIRKQLTYGMVNVVSWIVVSDFLLRILFQW